MATFVETDDAYAGQNLVLLAVKGGAAVPVRAVSRAVGVAVTGTIVANVPPITWAHVVVPVVPAGVVRPGQFAVASIISPVEDEFLITVQHTGTDEVHIFLLNLARAGGVFNDPVTFGIFDPEAP